MNLIQIMAWCNPETARAHGTKCGRPSGEASRLSKQGTKHKGFTYSIVKHQTPHAGYALSIIKGKETVLNGATLHPNQIQAFLDKNFDSLTSDPRAHVGGWYEPSSDKFFLDVSIIEPDLKKAVALGNKHSQLGIYDLKRGKTITTDYGRSHGIAASRDGRIAFHMKPRATAKEIYEALMKLRNQVKGK